MRYFSHALSRHLFVSHSAYVLHTFNNYYCIVQCMRRKTALLLHLFLVWGWFLWVFFFCKLYVHHAPASLYIHSWRRRCVCCYRRRPRFDNKSLRDAHNCRLPAARRRKEKLINHAWQTSHRHKKTLNKKIKE